MSLMWKPALIVCVAALVPPAQARADEFDSGQGSPVVLIHALNASAALNWGLPGITSTLASIHLVVPLARSAGPPTSL
jgi:hypothetical protein